MSQSQHDPLPVEQALTTAFRAFADLYFSKEVKSSSMTFSPDVTANNRFKTALEQMAIGASLKLHECTTSDEGVTYVYRKAFCGM
jgi:hypothetical protein